MRTLGSALVVDGHAPAERGEAELMLCLFSRSGLFSDVRYRKGVLPVQDLTTSWCAVWIASHVTIYRSARIGSLELRDGSRFLRFATAEAVKTLNTKLLVLSGCNTHAGPFAGPYVAQWVIGHRGNVTCNNALVFAARFGSELLTTTRRDRLTHEVVTSAFSAGRRSSGSMGWRLSNRSVS